VDTVLSFENTGRRAESIAHGVMPWPHPRTFRVQEGTFAAHPS
jgi:hypothetical protein